MATIMSGMFAALTIDAAGAFACVVSVDERTQTSP
jgi:hypothetical protein